MANELNLFGADPAEAERLAEQQRLDALVKSSPADALRRTQLEGASMAGRGLGTALASAAGQDARTPGEKKKDAFTAVQKALATSGAKPGSDAYWELMISEFTKHEMADAANAATLKWEAVKKDRAMTGYYDRGNQDKPLKGKDDLIAKLDAFNVQLASDPDNPQLLQARKNVETALERFYGVSQPKKANPWRTTAPAERHDGFQENQDDGTVRPLPVGIVRLSKPGDGKAEAVTPVTIADPRDPNKTIVVDGRTMRKIGDGPKMTQVGTTNLKRQIAHAGTADAIAIARQLLTGAGGGELPTESGVGTAVDYAGALVGLTPKGAKPADQLRVVGSSLVRNVPRFEGPQSDKDLAHYKEAAGRIGDSSLPIARRLAALDEVERIWGEFEAGKKYGYFSGAQTGAAPAAKPAAAAGGFDAAKKRRLEELRAKRANGTLK